VARELRFDRLHFVSPSPPGRGFPTTPKTNRAYDPFDLRTCGEADNVRKVLEIVAVLDTLHGRRDNARPNR
jgi:hypothetical protein